MQAVRDLFNIGTKAFTFIFELLPDDPFIKYISEASDAFSEYLHYLNYFVPVEKFAEITGVWISSISMYYAYRYAKNLINH